MRVPSSRSRTVPVVISTRFVPSFYLSHFCFFLRGPTPALAGFSPIQLFQTTLQLFHRVQGYQPKTSRVRREALLQAIARGLLTDALVLARDPFLADIHLPSLSTSGSSPNLYLLRLEVLFSHRLWCTFQAAITSTSF